MAHFGTLPGGNREAKGMTENTKEKDQVAQTTPKQPTDDVVTVVLTADNHLGYTAFGQQPRKREERQRRLRSAFQQAADFAVGQGVDLFIQAGDLFDTVTPDERDRSFVAERLARLKQAGVETFALGGMHDTPGTAQSVSGEIIPAPQLSYANLGALHYLPPVTQQEPVEPVLINIHGVLVGICGLGMLVGQEGDPLARLRVRDEIERAHLPILVMHAPIEGFSNSVVGSSHLETRSQVARSSIRRQSDFAYILAGYHHNYSRTRIGQTEIIVAGSTQHVDFSTPEAAPGFVFMGLAADGVRWCNHITVETLQLHRLVIATTELWPDDAHEKTDNDPTEGILARLRPLCNAEAMIQLRLEGELTRKHYHQLDLNRIRRYGEEHCFALAIDDSALLLHAESEVASGETSERVERFSPREELVALVDEWIALAGDEGEKKALRATKEELLLTLDNRHNEMRLYQGVKNVREVGTV